MKRIIIMLFLLLALSIAVSAGSEYCPVDDSSASCEISDGKLTMGELETAAFISEQQDEVCIVYFYSKTCSHCAAIKPLLDELEQKYAGEVHVTRYEVSDPENIKLYNQLCAMRGYSGKKIPLIGINDVILVGEEEINSHLEEEIKKGIENDEKICPLGGMACHANIVQNKTNGNSDNLIPGMKDLKWTSVMPIILLSGLGDGINPCAFIILIFVMVFLQQISGSRKRLVKVTFTYLITIFLTNLILGIIYFLFSANLGFPNFIRYAVIIISIIAGIINIKDFFFYGKGISLGIPKVTKKYLENLIHKASVPASFILGVSVAILEAPCSIPIYLAVMEILKGEGSTIASVFHYILIYNIMFILPMIVIAAGVFMGYKAHVFEKASLKSKKWMKLVIGLILVLLAIALLFGWL